MKTIPLLLCVLACAPTDVRALELPWEKEKAKASAEQGITPVEFVYRDAMDELHGRVGAKLKAGSPEISPKEIRVHIAVAGEGETDLVFVEKENDGKTALVVVGPPESEGDVYHLVRKGDSWAKEERDAPPPPEGREGIDVKIAGVTAKFFAALREGDVEKAYALTSPLYKERVDAKGFRAFLGRWPALREHGIAGVKMARNHRGVGLAEVELHVTELVVHKVHLEFDEVDGRWEVGIIEISGREGDPAAKSEQSPAAFIGGETPPGDAASDAAARKVMALPEAGEIAGKLKGEPQRFGPLAARIEEVPSEEQQKNYGFRFHGIVVGYDDNELARFMPWQRFAVEAATGDIKVYDVAEDKYVTLDMWRAARKAKE